MQEQMEATVTRIVSGYSTIHKEHIYPLEVNAYS